MWEFYKVINDYTYNVYFDKHYRHLSNEDIMKICDVMNKHLTITKGRVTYKHVQ